MKDGGRTQVPFPIHRPVLVQRYPPSRSTGSPTFWLACTVGAAAADALAPDVTWLAGSLKPTLLAGGFVSAANLMLLLGGSSLSLCAPSSTGRLFDAAASAIPTASLTLTHVHSPFVLAACRSAGSVSEPSTPGRPHSASPSCATHANLRVRHRSVDFELMPRWEMGMRVLNF